MGNRVEKFCNLVGLEGKQRQINQGDLKEMTAGLKRMSFSKKELRSLRRSQRGSEHIEELKGSERFR